MNNYANMALQSYTNTIGEPKGTYIMEVKIAKTKYKYIGFWKGIFNLFESIIKGIKEYFYDTVIIGDIEKHFYMKDNGERIDAKYCTEKDKIVAISILLNNNKNE